MLLILLIIGILIYIGFIAYLSGYWERAFGLRFPKCKYIIRTMLIGAGLFPFISLINFIWHPDFFALNVLVTIGFVVACFYLYLALFMVITHFFVFISHHILKKGQWTRNTKGRMIMISAEIIFSLFFCLWGLWNATHTEITPLALGQGKTQMKIVALADIHHGTPGSIVDLNKMVDLINTQKPDLVLVAGDVFDNDTERMASDNFTTTIANINSTYGTYVINGNHEYYQNNHAKIKEYYKNSGITLLVDQSVTIDNKLRIAGREDYTWKYINGQRTPLTTILKNTDNTLPLVVLDHQPQDYREAKKAGAILEIAGHTHNGQLWPGNILVYFINKWGYDSPSNGINNYEDFCLAITRGYGTWGFPMRTTGTSEIMTIELKESLWQN